VPGFILGWDILSSNVGIVTPLDYVRVLIKASFILFCSVNIIWVINYVFFHILRGTRWRSWLRHCATSRKVAVSIPGGVIVAFHWHNSVGRTMALGSTQPLTEMSTRNISWGIKAAGAYGWEPYHLHVPIVLKSGSLNLLETSRPVQVCTGTASHTKSLFPNNGNKHAPTKDSLFSWSCWVLGRYWVQFLARRWAMRNANFSHFNQRIQENNNIATFLKLCQ
jgi:hypothetical protein